MNKLIPQNNCFTHVEWQSCFRLVFAQFYWVIVRMPSLSEQKGCTALFLYRKDKKRNFYKLISSFSFLQLLIHKCHLTVSMPIIIKYLRMPLSLQTYIHFKSEKKFQNSFHRVYHNFARVNSNSIFKRKENTCNLLRQYVIVIASISH